MKRYLKTFWVATLTLTLLVSAGIAFARPGGHVDHYSHGIISLLRNIESSLDSTSQTVNAINSEVTDPNSGLVAINSGIQAIQSNLQVSTGPYRLSSGPFLIPNEPTGSADWGIVNESDAAQTVTVNVYKLEIGGAKQSTESLTITLAPGEASHNANNISGAGPYVPGFYYEVIVDTNSLDVLPTVDIWEDHGGDSVIPGTSIPAGSWVKLQ